MFLPEPIAEHENFVTAGLVFLWREDAPEHWRHSQRPKETRTDSGRSHLLWLRDAGQSEQASAIDRHLLENMIVALPIDVVGRRYGELIDAWKALRRRSVPDSDETVRIFEWQRTEQHRIDDAKDRRIGADPESQRDNCDRAEPRVLEELPRCQAKILEQAVHAPTSANSFLSSSSATTLPSKRWTSLCACFANRGSCVTMQIVAPSR